MFSPSAHELDTIRSAYAEADSFSYSPVFFTSRVEDILDSSSHGSHRAFFMGRCPLDFPYFRPDWADQPGHVAFTLFVSAFYKWILRISDMVPCESEEDGPMAISRQMFREDEWHADAKVSVDVTTLQRLADELMALALVSDIQDHAFYHAEQDPGCPGRLVVSGSENNLLFARDGRFAIFDLAPLCGPTSLATALRFMRWSDFSLLPLPDVEMSFGSVRRYFLFEDSGLRDILRDLERHYRGQEGARLFAAIVRRSGILGSDPSEESIGAHHAELLATLERYTRAMDSGEFYPWLRALLDAERAMPSPMTVAA